MQDAKTLIDRLSCAAVLSSHPSDQTGTGGNGAFRFKPGQSYRSIASREEPDVRSTGCR